MQVRSKPISARDLTALAAAVADAVCAANPATRVLINDRVDVAAALMPTHHIHGVHIGQDDLNPRLARAVLGPEAIIGLTTGTLELVRAANAYADVIDYVGAGPFRPTPTKDSGRPPIGVEGYPALVQASRCLWWRSAMCVSTTSPLLPRLGLRGWRWSARSGTRPIRRRWRVASWRGWIPVAEHVIIGAGIIGLTTAFELIDAGVDPAAVTIIDPEPISGATWAAGGMLAPIAEVQYKQEPLYPLMVESGRIFPDLIRRLTAAGAGPLGYRTEPTFVVGADRADAHHLTDLTEHQHAHGMEVNRLTVRQARRLEPGLHPRIAGAVEIPTDHQINPRLYTRNLFDLLLDRGVRHRPVAVEKLVMDGAHCVEVQAGEGIVVKRATVYLANGLGAAQLAPCRLELRPVRGDMLRLRVPDGQEAPVGRVVRAFVEDRPVYIIPRTDGTIAVGATSREDGRTLPAVDGVFALLRDAIRIVPGLEDCELIDATVGARPGTPDDLPYLGRVGENLIISTGYFRHGILLSALAGAVGARLGTGSAEGFDISACDPLRHTDKETA